MKKFIVILLSNFIFTISFAQTDAAYRIFGEIMTVENKVYKGFITWNGNKNYWIDFFEASKIENPYRSYFKRSDGLVFRANDREFITPPTHNFCCRFGNIKSIRPTDVNEIVLQLKNGDRLTLVKGYSSDIKYPYTNYYSNRNDLDKMGSYQWNSFYGSRQGGHCPRNEPSRRYGKKYPGYIQGNHLLEFPAKTKSGKNEPDKYFFKQN